MPRRTWEGRPSRTPLTSWSIAAGWSPFGSKLVCSLNISSKTGDLLPAARDAHSAGHLLKGVVGELDHLLGPLVEDPLHIPLLLGKGLASLADGVEEGVEGSSELLLDLNITYLALAVAGLEILHLFLI